MICINDPIEAFDLLEKHAQADFDPTCNHVSMFQCDQFYAVLFFCAQGNLKGPRLYLLSPPLHYTEIEAAIVADLESPGGDEHFAQAKNHFLATFRENVEAMPAGNFFFDAH